MDVCRGGRAGLLMALCAVLAGCGNQSAGNAGRQPGARVMAYLLFPLALGAPRHAGAVAPDAGEGSGAHAAAHAVEAEDMAPGAAAPSTPGMQAPVARGINQSEQVVGSYRLASGERRAFVWTAGQGMHDLNDLVRDKPAGLTLSDALAISDAGAIVAQGNTGLVLLRPASRPAGTAAMPLGD